MPLPPAPRRVAQKVEAHDDEHRAAEQVGTTGHEVDPHCRVPLHAAVREIVESGRCSAEQCAGSFESVQIISFAAVELANEKRDRTHGENPGKMVHVHLALSLQKFFI